MTDHAHPDDGYRPGYDPARGGPAPYPTGEVHRAPWLREPLPNGHLLPSEPSYVDELGQRHTPAGVDLGAPYDPREPLDPEDGVTVARDRDPQTGEVTERIEGAATEPLSVRRAEELRRLAEWNESGGDKLPCGCSSPTCRGGHTDSLAASDDLEALRARLNELHDAPGPLPEHLFDDALRDVRHDVDEVVHALTTAAIFTGHALHGLARVARYAPAVAWRTLLAATAYAVL